MLKYAAASRVVNSSPPRRASESPVALLLRLRAGPLDSNPGAVCRGRIGEGKFEPVLTFAAPSVHLELHEDVLNSSETIQGRGQE